MIHMILGVSLALVIVGGIGVCATLGRYTFLWVVFVIGLVGSAIGTVMFIKYEAHGTYNSSSDNHRNVNNYPISSALVDRYNELCEPYGGWTFGNDVEVVCNGGYVVQLKKLTPEELP